MAEITNVERQLAFIVAGWTGKTYDTDLWVGEIPSGKNGIGIMILTDLQDDDGFIPHWSFQIVVKYDLRKDVQTVLDDLRQNLPAYGIDSQKKQDGTEDPSYLVHFLEILKRGAGDILKDTSDSKVKYLMYYNGTIRFRD